LALTWELEKVQVPGGSNIDDLNNMDMKEREDSDVQD